MKTDTRIVINGVQYTSLEDVPEEFRSLLIDRDRNGIPDIADKHLRDQNLGGTGSSTSEITVEQKVYSNIEDCPEEVKEQLRRALGESKGRLAIDKSSNDTKLTYQTPLQPVQQSNSLGLLAVALAILLLICAYFFGLEF